MNQSKQSYPLNKKPKIYKLNKLGKENKAQSNSILNNKSNSKRISN